MALLDKKQLTRLSHMHKALTAWFRVHQRDLPWRRTRNAYGIWVSEIMLQQTRVATVIPYWQKWMARFPDIAALAEAPQEDVLAHWAGLGYYSRARNLQKGAQLVLQQYNGAMPNGALALREVPGIGPYTAGAIASIAFAERTPLVDGNVARVLARWFEVPGVMSESAFAKTMWAIAALYVDQSDPHDERAPGDANQALMELGAMICTPRNPECKACPARNHCAAFLHGTTETYPSKKIRVARADIRVLRSVGVFAIDNQQRVLLARRGQQGLYAGLWEIPQSETVNDLDVASDHQVTFESEPFYTTTQELTHRTLEIAVHRGLPRSGKTAKKAGFTAGANAPTPRYQYVEHKWVPVDVARTLGIAAPTARLLLQLETSSWNQIPKPSNTSISASKKSSKALLPSATIPVTTTSKTRRSAQPKGSTNSAATATKQKKKSTR